jgi:hypothetical protein
MKMLINKYFLIALTIILIAAFAIYFLGSKSEKGVSYGSSEFLEIKNDLIMPLCEFHGKLEETDIEKYFFSEYNDNSGVINDYKTAFSPATDMYVSCVQLETNSAEEADEKAEELIKVEGDDEGRTGTEYIYTITYTSFSQGDRIKMVPRFYIGKEDGEWKVLDIATQKTAYI